MNYMVSYETMASHVGTIVDRMMLINVTPDGDLRAKIVNEVRKYEPCALVIEYMLDDEDLTYLTDYCC